MTLGKTPIQTDLFRSTTEFCEPRVKRDSIYALLHRECFALFPDELFADLFTDVGRRSVPPLIVAVVMILQRFEGLSDRDAVERFCFDARYKYAAGGLSFDYPGFAHTVLVDMRARLARSERPNRIFEVTLEVAKAAGLVGVRRVLDSTPLYDAVATMDTVTLVYSAIRRTLGAADEREPELRALLSRDDDYAGLGKPACDYSDRGAREDLIAALAADGYALLAALQDQDLPDQLAEMARLTSTLLGQDLDEGADGRYRIARRVARDRIISTVDTEARHGHKTAAHSFDGYKGHIAIDPDTEIVTATAVSPGNAGDASVAGELLVAELAGTEAIEILAAELAGTEAIEPDPDREPDPEPLTVYGDAAYGTGALIESLEAAGAKLRLKVAVPTAPAGRFPKTAFAIDLENRTVSCPAGRTVALGRTGASFGQSCATCPLVTRCTDSKNGRSISVGPHEATLQRARAVQRDPAWRDDYRAVRPKVERKIGHLMRRRHGGRRARVRGKLKVAADFALRAAAVNLARLAVLRLVRSEAGWAIGTP
ncbi:MAG TPA: transposase [Candidatus Limnocylindrales bacterium]